MASPPALPGQFTNKMSEQKETLTDLLFYLNEHIQNEQVSNKVIDKLVKDMAELKRQNDVLHAIQKKHNTILMRQFNYPGHILETIDDDDDDKIKSDETRIRKAVDSYMEHFLEWNDIKTEQVWEQYAGELKQLGVYDDMMKLIAQ